MADRGTNNITDTPVYPASPGKIGVFDSGYGGLTILKGIRKVLPQYDYLYLGDNARAPYGTRSFELVYQFTLDAVRELFSRGCHLVILACNTASAKALRSIQQNDLPHLDPDRRVLGVIRPTVEHLGQRGAKHVGIVATPGTVVSHSYTLEITKLFPEMHVTEQGCPMWVPLIENNESSGPGADYFVHKYLKELFIRDSKIDSLVLGCTHYPLMIEKIRQYTPAGVAIIAQGEIVGESLRNYLLRHPEMEAKCSRGGSVEYLTTENPEKFNSLAGLFMGETVSAGHLCISHSG